MAVTEPSTRFWHRTAQRAERPPGKVQCANRHRHGANNRNRAIEPLTIASMNMSSPLRGIGLRQRQTATTTKREIGRITLKTLLAGVAFAIAVAFSSQASAFPYCTKITCMGITTFALLMRNKPLLQAAGSDESSRSKAVGNGEPAALPCPHTCRVGACQVHVRGNVGCRTNTGAESPWSDCRQAYALAGTSPTYLRV